MKAVDLDICKAIIHMAKGSDKEASGLDVEYLTTILLCLKTIFVLTPLKATNIVYLPHSHMYMQ